MSFFGRIISHFVQDAAVERLANSKAFQRVAVKVVESQAHLERAAKEAAADPEKAKAVLSETSKSFWAHLKAEVQRDIGAAPAKPASAGPAKVAAPPNKLE